MAKSSRKPPPVRPIRSSEPVSDGAETATAVLDAPDSPEFEAAASPEPVTPFDEPKPAKQKVPKSITFFDRVQDIALADWGTRAKIKVYRLAPIINRLVGSENKYVTIYREPVTEEKIKTDHGSGRYRLYLNYKSAGEKGEKELDMVEFDILDPKYPPNIPAGEWVEDPRNKEWSWARQPGMPAAPIPVAAAPAPASSVSDLVNILRVTGDIRRDMKEEMRESAPPPPPPVVPVPPVAQPDTFSAGIQIAQTLLQMRADNPVVDMMRDEMKAMREEIRAEREANRALQNELRQSQNVQQTAPQPKGILEQLKEFGEAKSLLQTVFGVNPATAAAEPLRSGKMGWLDFGREVLPEIINAPIVNALASRIMGGGPAPVIQNMNPTAANPADDVQQFVRIVVTPALTEYFRAGEDGGEFAAFIHNGYPARLPELQSFGEQNIFQLYKMSAPRETWAILSGRGEHEFAKFVHEFCQWKPDADDDGPPTATTYTVEPTGQALPTDRAAASSSSGIVDLDTDDREEKGS